MAAKLEIELSNRQTRYAVDARRLKSAARRVLAGEDIRAGSLSLAVVDDEAMQRLNRQYLNHDYATDVLSFLLARDGDRLDGEVIVSADTAAAACEKYGWPAADELLLYVIHGTLHLAGYDDHSPTDIAAMRRRERHYLKLLGVEAAQHG